MNVANLYRKLKQILDDSNLALSNRGLDNADNLYEVPMVIGEVGEINRLKYAVERDIIEITENDLMGATSIVGYAFYFCSSLISVTIPNSVTSIGYSAFWNCVNLANIYLKSSTPPILNSTDSIPNTATIHVPIGSGDAYKNTTNWSSHADRIVEDIVVE